MLLYKLIIAVVLVIQPKCCNCFFGSKVNSVINKAKAYYKSKFQKDKTWHFLGYDLSEYPGTHKEYRQMNKEKWSEYYECLKIQNDNLGPHRSVIPEAVQGFEGGSISFDCKICLNPRERENIDSVEWHWAPLNSSYLHEIEYTEHILLSPEDKTLTLYNLCEDQTGQYMCKLGESLTAPYFLTVITSTTKATEVHTQYANHGPYPSTSTLISEHGLVLDTVWSQWSPCNTCGKVGKRHKFGYCVIYMDSQLNWPNKREATSSTSSEHTEILHTTNITTNQPWWNIKKYVTKLWHKNSTHNTTGKQSPWDVKKFIKQLWKKNETEESKNNTHKTTQNENVPEKDLQLLKIFKNGIPCLSHILPESIKKMIQTENKTNEIMIGYCKVPCHENSVFVVKDKDGKVIEQANNSAGIYSMLQGMPPVEPPVARFLQYEVMGKNIIISCPGNLNSDTPIQWQVGPKKLVPELIAQQSKGRIFISLLDKINIKKAKIADSNIYSCWQNNELAGTVRLVVEKKIKMTFNHHIMLIGMIIILSVFLSVFTRAFFGRKYARIAK